MAGWQRGLGSEGGREGARGAGREGGRARDLPPHTHKPMHARTSLAGGGGGARGALGQAGGPAGHPRRRAGLPGRAPGRWHGRGPLARLSERRARRRPAFLPNPARSLRCCCCYAFPCTACVSLVLRAPPVTALSLARIAIHRSEAQDRAGAQGWSTGGRCRRARGAASRPPSPQHPCLLHLMVSDQRAPCHAGSGPGRRAPPPRRAPARSRGSWPR